MTDEKEKLSATIQQLQRKYTQAVKAYSIVKNASERQKAKTLITNIGTQIAELRKRLNSLPWDGT